MEERIFFWLEEADSSWNKKSYVLLKVNMDCPIDLAPDREASGFPLWAQHVYCYQNNPYIHEVAYLFIHLIYYKIISITYCVLLVFSSVPAIWLALYTFVKVYLPSCSSQKQFFFIFVQLLKSSWFLTQLRIILLCGNFIDYSKFFFHSFMSSTL